MADRVWLAHPDLPGQPIQVAEAAVPHYQASGWAPTDPPPPRKRLAPKKPQPKPKTPETPAVDAGVSASDDPEPAKRRRTTTKEQDA